MEWYSPLLQLLEWLTGEPVGSQGFWPLLGVASLVLWIITRALVAAFRGEGGFIGVLVGLLLSLLLAAVLHSATALYLVPELGEGFLADYGPGAAFFLGFVVGLLLVAKPLFKLDRLFSLFAACAGLAAAGFALYAGQMLVGALGQGTDKIEQREIPSTEAR